MRALLTLLVLFFMIQSPVAQNVQGKTDDLGRLVLNTYVSDDMGNMPKEAKSFLINKLNQITSANGLGGSDVYQRFILTPNIAVLAKEFTSTAPAMIIFRLELSLFIGDGIDGVLFANGSLELKGVGENETKAYISALKNIKPQDPSIQELVTVGKNKIIGYYNDRCDFILNDAESLANEKQFEAALLLLHEVPEVCKDCHFKAYQKAKVIYKQYIDNKCQEDLTRARASWAAFDEAGALNYLSEIFPDSKCYGDALALVNEIKDHECHVALGQAKGAWANLDAERTAEYLAQVPSDSKCSKEAEILSNTVRSKLSADVRKKWDLAYEKYNRDQIIKEEAQYHQFNQDYRNQDLKEQQFDHQAKMDNRKMDFTENQGFNLEKERIRAAGEVGVAYGKNQPRSLTYNIKGWF